MLTEETRSELEEKLRPYNDDDDFVYGVIDRLEDEEDRITMIRFINTARALHDESITQDELILLSIALADKRAGRTAGDDDNLPE